MSPHLNVSPRPIVQGALWGYSKKGRTGGGPFKPALIRLSYIRSLKYHLVVMLGARIDVVETSIRNFYAYLLSLPAKKTTTAVVKRNKMRGLDRNDLQT